MAMISVIIPAHNEANVIGKTLEALLSGVVVEEIEIIVVCNACSDNTVNIVKSFADKVKCIESPVASKTHAINLGDRAASGFPRIYLDADVTLAYHSLLKLVKIIKQKEYLAAAPQMHMDLRNVSWVVKSYYDIWRQLAYVKEGMIGTGVYALSEEGRKRFKDFPNVIADDGFVRAIFKKYERTSVEDCYSIVCAPAKLSNLIKIKTRSRLGRYELAQKYPELLSNESKEYINSICQLIKFPHNWLKLTIYVYVNIVTRIRAKRYYHIHGFSGWERDDSSRETTVS